MDIVTFPQQCLRRRATQDGQKIMPEQWQKMQQLCIEHEGIGLAANQVGLPHRAFLLYSDDIQLQICNPRMKKIPEAGFTVMQEGCLSLPGEMYEVKRANEIHLTWNDPEGVLYEERIGGLAAIIIQHEMDHLRGKLIKDVGKKI